MESLKEGEICFFNKTILGALSLDMIAVRWSVALLPILHRIFKSRPKGLGFEQHLPLLALLILIISAYIPFTKNAGMKLLAAILGLEFASLFLTILYFLVVAALLSGVDDFRW
jgi:hypothetical protein